MKEIVIFGITVWMFVTCVNVSAQNKKSLGAQNKACIKAMKKEGWYVNDGRSLSVAFARFDSLYYRHRFSGGIIGFSYGQDGPTAIFKAEEDAITKCVESILGLYMESRMIRWLDDSTFKSAKDMIFGNFPMPEFVLLRDKGYGYYDCQSYYFIDENTRDKMRDMLKDIPVKVKGKSIIDQIDAILFDEKRFRETYRKKLEEFRKQKSSK